MPAQERILNPLDSDENIAIGVSLPIGGPIKSFPSTSNYDVDNYVSGSGVPVTKSRIFESTYTTADQLKVNLINLLLTRPGERFFRPTLGTRLYDYVFEPNTDLLHQNLKEILIEDVKRWLPRLEIVDLRMQNSSDRHQINISIDYVINQGELDTIDIVLSDNGSIILASN